HLGALETFTRGELDARARGDLSAHSLELEIRAGSSQRHNDAQPRLLRRVTGRRVYHMLERRKRVADALHIVFRQWLRLGVAIVVERQAVAELEVVSVAVPRFELGAA